MRKFLIGIAVAILVLVLVGIIVANANPAAPTPYTWNDVVPVGNWSVAILHGQSGRTSVASVDTSGVMTVTFVAAIQNDGSQAATFPSPTWQLEENSLVVSTCTMDERLLELQPNEAQEPTVTCLHVPSASQVTLSLTGLPDVPTIYWDLDFIPKG